MCQLIPQIPPCGQPFSMTFLPTARISFRYLRRTACRLYFTFATPARRYTDETHSYVGDFYPHYENRIFVAYNLFSLWADKVAYDEKNRIIEAHENVCAMRESDSLVCDYSMTFKIENGQAIRVRTSGCGGARFCCRSDSTLPTLPTLRLALPAHAFFIL
jgi:hypothetical protein